MKRFRLKLLALLVASLVLLVAASGTAQAQDVVRGVPICPPAEGLVRCEVCFEDPIAMRSICVPVLVIVVSG